MGKGARWMQRSKITEGFVEEAIPFIKKARSEEKPFYLNLWPDDVHSPFWPPTAKWGDGSKRRLYLSVLEAMDEQLGKLFDFVRNDPKLAGNTLILACSDNGAEKGAGTIFGGGQRRWDACFMGGGKRRWDDFLGSEEGVGTIFGGRKKALGRAGPLRSLWEPGCW